LNARNSRTKEEIVCFSDFYGIKNDQCKIGNVLAET